MSKIARAFISSLKGIVNKRNAKELLVGSDDFGNKYYERQADSSKGLKQLRRVEPLTVNDPSIVPKVPAEWMTWLQERREHPPTPEELHKNKQTMLKTLRRAKELDRAREQEIASSEFKQEAEPMKPTGINFPVYEDYMPQSNVDKAKKKD